MGEFKGVLWFGELLPWLIVKFSHLMAKGYLNGESGVPSTLHLFSGIKTALVNALET